MLVRPRISATGKKVTWTCSKRRPQFHVPSEDNKQDSLFVALKGVDLRSKTYGFHISLNCKNFLGGHSLF